MAATLENIRSVTEARVNALLVGVLSHGRGAA